MPITGTSIREGETTSARSERHRGKVAEFFRFKKVFKEHQLSRLKMPQIFYHSSFLSESYLSNDVTRALAIVTLSRTFSRASCFDWFTGLFVSFVIGQSNYFGSNFKPVD